MQNGSFGMLLLVALGWGIRHAFDADHVMTVTGLSQQLNTSRRAQMRRFFAFCLHWSIGHGGILILIGASVLLLGMTIPHQLGVYAEFVCATLLLALGVGLLSGLLFKPRQTPQGTLRNTLVNLSSAGGHILRRRPRQCALTVGLLHGLSGSAPLLALLPLMNLHSAWYGLLYLICFGLGVTLGMLLFASFLSLGYQRLANTQRMLNRIRWILGLSSIIYGVAMLMEIS